MLRQPSEVEAISAQESLINSTERIALRRILALPPNERTPQELVSVHRALQKAEFVAKLDVRIQEDLAKIVAYKQCEPCTTLFEEGDIAKCFYIIVSGSVAVRKRSGDGSDPMTLLTLTAGQSFGESALVEELSRRAATIVTTSEVECLTIEGDIYRSYLARIHQEDLQRKVDVLRHQSTFVGWDLKELEHLASIMSVRKVPYNTVIIEQDRETDALYFIKSGEKLFRELERDPQLSTRISPSSTWSVKYKSLPKDRMPSPRSPPLTQRSSVSRVSSEKQPIDSAEDIFLELMTLGPYSTFGEIAALKGSPRAASVISNAVTELLVLTRYDLLNKIDGSTRKKLEEHCEAYRNDNELLADLIEGLKWERYKADLVKSILAERQKEHYLVSHTDSFGDEREHVPKWKP